MGNMAVMREEQLVFGRLRADLRGVEIVSGSTGRVSLSGPNVDVSRIARPECDGFRVLSLAPEPEALRD